MKKIKEKETVQYKFLPFDSPFQPFSQTEINPRVINIEVRAAVALFKVTYCFIRTGWGWEGGDKGESWSRMVTFFMACRDYRVSFSQPKQQWASSKEYFMATMWYFCLRYLWEGKKLLRIKIEFFSKQNNK